MKDKHIISSLLKGDQWIWLVYGTLVIISVLEIASASSRLATRALTNDNPLASHTLKLILGFFFCVLIGQNLAIKRIGAVKGLGVIAFILGLLAMILMPFFGRSINGAQRDIFGLQPVEILKLGLVITLCLLVSLKDAFFQQRWSVMREHTQLKRFWIAIIIIGAACFFILLQNLSTALILGATSLAILFMAGINWKWLIKLILALSVVGGIGLGGLYAVYSIGENQGHDVNLGLLNRANTWANRLFEKDEIPLWEQRVSDDNMQVMYAHVAIANSEVHGQFFGNSQMRDFLPEAYSDYIYAIIWEETGIVGAALVMILYLFLLWRCYRIALKADNSFDRLLITAIPLMIVIQAFIHMGVCCDAMFVTGQPLPLISRGGMSTIVTSAEFGLLFGLSHRILKKYNAR